MKFAILHHSACDRSLFHYRIDMGGARICEMPEGERGEHAKAIGIVLDGDFDAEAPSPAQIAALKVLLLQLKKRYPHIVLGGHRQVRADETSCPGKQFPLASFRDWSRSELLAQRDAEMLDEVDRQYYRR